MHRHLGVATLDNYIFKNVHISTTHKGTHFVYTSLNTKVAYISPQDTYNNYLMKKLKYG